MPQFEASTELQIVRLVSSALHQHEVRFCEATHAGLPKETCEGIDRLLCRPPSSQADRIPPTQADSEAASVTVASPNGQDETPLFQMLKMDPGWVGL
ncbi:MAG: hypothetical protein ABSE06_01215 [Anaerolineaceae bacterium]